MDTSMDPNDVRPWVRQRYGAIASQPGPAVPEASCCAPANLGCCQPSGDGAALLSLDELAITSEQLYQPADLADLPAEVRNLSLGCGDPVTLAQLEPGQTVLDLGAGGGIDCFLASRRVGPTGRVIGVDMTPTMLERARANKAKMGADNVEFRLGEIEHLPVADNSVDVIISNCVINLSPDKPQVFREAFRVLRPGGRLAVSDIVSDRPLPPEMRADLAAWASCIAGAWEVTAIVSALEETGFVSVEIEREGEEPAGDSGDDKAGAAPVYSARITARKPAV